MRALSTWSGAIVGLLLIVAGGLLPASIPWPDGQGLAVRSLGITLQVPALLFTALITGPRSALLAAVAYLSVGLFQLPVFLEGGGLSYLLNPGFGYLAGFLPAAWVTGRLARQQGMEDPLALSAAAAVGLLVLQFCGLVNLLLGALAGRWNTPLMPMLAGYTLAIGPQLLLCCAAGLLAWVLRRVLLVRP